MTKTKSFKGAPFGVQSLRFSCNGFHPKRMIPGTFITDDEIGSKELGPGSYEIKGDWDPLQLERKASGPDWKRAYMLERMATMPHLLYRDQWEEKQKQKTKLGPGTYDVDDYQSVAAYVKKGTPGRGVLQTREERFPDVGKNDVPPPGAYGVPHALKEEMDGKRKQPSIIGMLDSGGSGIRSLPTMGSHLGPGTYNIKDSVQEMTAKMTGLRGPFDIFSGNRSGPIKEGHYATPKGYDLGPGQYDLKSSVDELSRGFTNHRGKFLKGPQYPAKPHDRGYWMSISAMPPDPVNQVGPASYEVNESFRRTKSFLKTNPGFLAGSQRQDRRSLMFFTGNFNPVGPGRYDIQRVEDFQHVNAHTNDFISKTGARPKAELAEVMRERLRDVNIPPNQKVLVDHYSTEESPSVNISNSFKLRTLKMV